MTDTLLFDLFGVIARLQSPAGKHRLVEAAGLDPADSAAFWTAYWERRPGYDRGDVTGPEYWHEVAADLGTAFDDRRTAGLVRADVASWSGVDPEMVALVEQSAASGRRLGLLSNIPEELAAYCEQQHHWLKHFQVRAFSCRIGRVKPEPDAYRWCLRALGTEPGRVLFVDDHAENIRAAGAVGLRTHLFTSPERLRTALGL